jgi:hypothetical protein
MDSGDPPIPSSKTPADRVADPIDGRPVFTVATNPDADSKLPYLIRIPLANVSIVLKAAQPWPRTAKVYCHRADEWPEDAQILDEIKVRSCVRRGQAIDLVLDRARENRSQLVFTTIRGREGIFWQTARTARASRPGVRVPARRASGVKQVVIAIDTRERYPYRFARQAATTYRRALPIGDYGVEHDDEIVAVVERKGLADMAKALVEGSLAFALAELTTIGRAAIVVEDRYGALLKVPRVAPGFLADLLGALQVRYPAVPIVFCDSRPLAEEWTYRFLGAALARVQQDPKLIDG